MVKILLNENVKKLKENNISIDEENEINIKKIIIKEDGKEITIEIKE